MVDNSRTFKSEKDVKTAVKQVLNSLPKCWWFMPPANGYGRSGIPDFVGCINGSFFAIETKFGGNSLSAHQIRETSEIIAANGAFSVVNDRNFSEWEVSFRGLAAVCS